MSDEELDVAHEAMPEEAKASMSVAHRLVAARKEKGMSLEQVAAKTRVTQRHLELIEAGKFTALPGRTYAIGFAKNFARVVGESEEEIAKAVREEFAIASPERAMAERGADFEPGDPGKVPRAGLAWLSFFAVILLGIGAYAFYSTYFGTGASPGELVAEAQEALADATDSENEAATEEEAAVSGPVVFTARDELWVRFYDGADNVLFEKLMQEGESWTLPDDAVDPQINTGRPDALAITIGGSSVPVLDPKPIAIVDVAVSASALLAREEEAAGETDGAVAE